MRAEGSHKPCMHESAKKKKSLHCQEDELGTAVENNTAGLILGCVTYVCAVNVSKDLQIHYIYFLYLF